MPKYYYYNGIISTKGLSSPLHRVDGPASEDREGNLEWYLDGKLHREDGPAVVYKDGTSYWYVNGQLHREDGPARVYSTGEEAHYIKGVYHTRKQFDRKTVGLLISLKRRLLVLFVRFLLYPYMKEG